MRRGVAEGTPKYAGHARFVVVIDERGTEIFRAAVEACN
jgi:hypothetical protein